MKKEFCKRCFKDNLKSAVWNFCDDARWEVKKIFCIKERKVISHKKIPKNCNYYLEHILSEKNTNHENRS